MSRALTSALVVMAAVVLAAAAVVPAVVMAPAGAPPAWATGAECLPPPVTTPITSPFRPPGCPYCAGHRGVTYEPPPGAVVRAVIGGTVLFAGQVAGVRWVVVADSEGRRWSYGHLGATLVRAGQRVVAQQAVGLSGRVLHLGLRVGEDYAGPAPLLGAWRGRPRLVPVDGSAPRPPPPPTLACAA